MQKEIDSFNKQQGLPPGIMPLKMDFVRANRYDLSHAVERWGGLYDLAELLDYQAGPFCHSPCFHPPQEGVSDSCCPLFLHSVTRMNYAALFLCFSSLSNHHLPVS